ncbi:hypothetical protein, partial [Vibrio fluvialis]|uniref:hypothetical protein n=1 Tax=Vibrio fluvialis TaxID=676 RepID=UPI001ED947CD
SPVLKVSSGLNQVFLVLHGAFLILDKHLVNQSWRVKLSYAAVSSPQSWHCWIKSLVQKAAGYRVSGATSA